MNITFAPNDILQIDDARLIYKNFSGAGSKFNKPGDRNFSVVIPNQELAEEMMNHTNEFGVGWNVKIRQPREEGDTPFIHFPVKVKFNGRGPIVYLESGGKVNKLDEESINILDDIDIAHVDLDVRPYDDEFNGKPFRSAYLQSMRVVQELDRFAEQYAE